MSDAEDNNHNREEEKAKASPEKEEAVLIFPKASIKRIMKIDPETRQISSDAIVLVARAAEMFVEKLSKTAYRQASANKRKTIKYEDIADARIADRNLEFLEGYRRPMVSSWAIICFLIIFVGYTISNSLLQYCFYYRRAGEASKWKIQPHRRGGVGDRAWWSSLGGGHVQESKARAPLHRLFATVNLTIASCFAGYMAECTVRSSGSRLYRHDWPDTIPPWNQQAMEGVGPLATEIILLAIALVWQACLEYYWHLLMHTPVCYAYFHKAFGYYCILYSPCRYLPMHVYTWVAYMVIHGTFGILDHSGIAFHIPGLYDTVDHDAHHSKVWCNYAFPFPHLDILHSTYTGRYLGRQYRAKPWKRRREEGGPDNTRNVTKHPHCALSDSKPLSSQ